MDNMGAFSPCLQLLYLIIMKCQAIGGGLAWQGAHHQSPFRLLFVLAHVAHAHCVLHPLQNSLLSSTTSPWQMLQGGAGLGREGSDSAGKEICVTGCSVLSSLCLFFLLCCTCGGTGGLHFCVLGLARCGELLVNLEEVNPYCSSVFSCWIHGVNCFLASSLKVLPSAGRSLMIPEGALP